MIAQGIAPVSIRRNVLVERVVLTRVDIDSVGARQTNTDGHKEGRKEKGK